MFDYVLDVFTIYTGHLCIVIKFMLCVSEKSNLFLKDPTDLMTNMYGDTVVTTNGKHMYTQKNLSNSTNMLGTSIFQNGTTD